MKVNIFFFLIHTVCSFFLQIEPSKSDGLRADDVEGAIQKVLAPGYITNLDHFISTLEKDKQFIPHGRLEHAFSVTPCEYPMC